jgi:hypothetical protein
LNTRVSCDSSNDSKVLPERPEPLIATTFTTQLCSHLPLV